LFIQYQARNLVHFLDELFKFHESKLDLLVERPSPKLLAAPRDVKTVAEIKDRRIRSIAEDLADKDLLVDLRAGG